MTDTERVLLEERFGEGFVAWNGADAEYRTTVKDGRCVFQRDNACSIHGAAFYPSMCRNFPERNLADDGPYEHDVSICPELTPLVDPKTKRLRVVARSV